MVPEARTDLVKKSKELLIKSWKRDGSIFENHNSVTGQGEDVNGADAFYHWGALLSFLSIMEGQTFRTPRSGSERHLTGSYRCRSGRPGGI